MSENIRIKPTGGQIPDVQFFHKRIDDALQRYADDVLAELETGPLSYKDCRKKMLQLAGRFADLGLGPGARILIRSGRDLDVLVVFLAALRCGVAPILADAKATDKQIYDLVKHCDVSAIFADQLVPETASACGVPLVPFGPEGATADGPSPDSVEFPRIIDEPQHAMLVLTSGTTSVPKAVELTFGNLVAQLNTISEAFSFGPDTKLMNLLPLHHVDGIVRGPLAALWNGGTVLRTPKFAIDNVQEIFTSVRGDAVTHIVTVPAVLRILERINRDRPVSFKTEQFNAILCSSDVLDAALWARCEEVFDVPVVNSYGLSEVTCDVLIAGPSDATRKIGTLGVAVDCIAKLIGPKGEEVPTGETGELVLAGATVMRGYFRSPEETKDAIEDGFFHTGDYFRINSKGFFEFVGRKKTAIVSAGVTIHPETATQLLSSMSGVSEAAAFGIDDGAMGEKLVGVIVNVSGVENTVADAAAFCRASLAPEQCPRDYLILKELPRNASGKVIIPELRQMYLSAVPQEQPMNTEAKILHIAASCFNVDVNDLSLVSTPFDTPGWDSLAHINLVDSLEEAFDIQFSAADIVQIMSLQDADNLIRYALGAAE